MSSLPGYTLEAYLMWEFNLIVNGDNTANVSMLIAETLGVTHVHRLAITQAEFKPLVAIYEPYREVIEQRLNDFDEENQSWRDYAEYVSIEVPKEVYNVGVEIKKGLKR
jgi:hypothetical protein